MINRSHGYYPGVPMYGGDVWLERNRNELERCLRIFSDLRAAGQPDLAMLSVALREVGGLVQAD